LRSEFLGKKSPLREQTRGRSAVDGCRTCGLLGRAAEAARYSRQGLRELTFCVVKSERRLSVSLSGRRRNYTDVRSSCLGGGKRRASVSSCLRRLAAPTAAASGAVGEGIGWRSRSSPGVHESVPHRLGLPSSFPGPAQPGPVNLTWQEAASAMRPFGGLRIALLASDRPPPCPSVRLQPLSGTSSAVSDRVYSAGRSARRPSSSCSTPWTGTATSAAAASGTTNRNLAHRCPRGGRRGHSRDPPGSPPPGAQGAHRARCDPHAVCSSRSVHPPAPDRVSLASPPCSRFQPSYGHRGSLRQRSPPRGPARRRPVRVWLCRAGMRPRVLRWRRGQYVRRSVSPPG
jgi:hypothetical protein